MREWCRNSDFRAALPELLEGEDEDFQNHIRRIAASTQKRRTDTVALVG
jgi:hypothetical protein